MHGTVWNGWLELRWRAPRHQMHHTDVFFCEEFWSWYLAVRAVAFPLQFEPSTRAGQQLKQQQAFIAFTVLSYVISRPSFLPVGNNKILAGELCLVLTSAQRTHCWTDSPVPAPAGSPPFIEPRVNISFCPIKYNFIKSCTQKSFHPRLGSSFIIRTCAFWGLDHYCQSVFYHQRLISAWGGGAWYAYIV